jgi:DNA repair and recombination protein RAD54 and RAD54-like protein
VSEELPKRIALVHPRQISSSLSFSIPGMQTTSSTEMQHHQLSGTSLGIRRQPILIPRPLHDPMQDHAIVLYDPTIDDKPDPVEEEAMRLDAEKAKEEVLLAGPHKSLKQILGLDMVKKKEASKVPVVIDPRLSKVLRPHQVEGVKVRLAFGRYSDDGIFH